MSEEETYTSAEPHRLFAIDFHGRTWDLLDRADRTKEEDELMVYTAFASARLWLDAGTGLHHQRGEWMISRVCPVLGRGEAAVRHADRCLALTKEHADLLEDFDRAFAYEAVARANAVAGNQDEALKYIELAAKAGEAIEEQESKDIFLSGLNGGNWNGLR